MDYSKLEGKIITVETKAGRKDFAKVALVDPDIGITIMHPDKHYVYIFCLIMPGSPKYKNISNPLDPEVAKGFFNFICEKIEDGWLSEDDIYTHLNFYGGEYICGSHPTARSCAFN